MTTLKQKGAFEKEYKIDEKSMQSNFTSYRRHQMSSVMRKPALPYANNKGADQPAHPRSLISAFVVRCLDNIIPPHRLGTASNKLLTGFSRFYV